MTRTNFLKSIGVILGVAVTAPLKLLKGKEVDDVVRVTGDVVVHNPFLKYPQIHDNMLNEHADYLRQYPFTEEECFSMKPSGELWDIDDVVQQRKAARKIKEQILLCGTS